MKCKILCNMMFLALVSLSMATPVSASVVNSGVETTTASYVFGERSTATYHQSAYWVFDGGNFYSVSPPDEVRNISGSFDVEFSHYWWEYTLGYPDGSTAITDQYWMTLENSTVTGVSDWSAFSLFVSQIRSQGNDYSSLSGDTSPCSMPMGPDTYCTGFSIGSISSITGGLTGGLLNLNGAIPLGYSGDTYTYHLEAVPVPIPATGILWGSALAGLSLMSRLKLGRSLFR